MDQNHDNSEEEIDEEPDDTGLPSSPTPSRKTRQSFSRLRYELDQEDLSSAGVQKMLLSEIERLELEAEQLESFRKNYHSTHVEKVVLNEKLKTKVYVEILFAVGLTLGSAILGLIPSINSETVSDWVFVCIAAVLIIAAVAAKIWREKQ